MRGKPGNSAFFNQAPSELGGAQAEVMVKGQPPPKGFYDQKQKKEAPQ
jgi:hypothetical protein